MGDGKFPSLYVHHTVLYHIKKADEVVHPRQTITDSEALDLMWSIIVNTHNRTLTPRNMTSNCMQTL